MDNRITAKNPVAPANFKPVTLAIFRRGRTSLTPIRRHIVGRTNPARAFRRLEHRKAGQACAQPRHSSAQNYYIAFHMASRSAKVDFNISSNSLLPFLFLVPHSNKLLENGFYFCHRDCSE